ncbi:MAG: N-acetylmuramoyl-L-alanine amidase [Gemmatimonadaceae bacterium]
MHRVSRMTALFVFAASACAPPVSPGAPAPVASPPSSATGVAPAPGTPAPPSPLPPIPRVDGPLAIHVVYPDTNQRLTARDSNFIFGSVGSGNAVLTINGAPVEVKPNGAFLAYVPVPGDSAPRYEVVATRGADTSRAMLPIRLPPARARFALDGPLFTDTLSVAPRGVLARRDDERMRVSVRTATNAVAWLRLDNADRQPLVPAPPRAGVTDSAALVLAGTVWSTDVPARQLRKKTELVIARGRDTARFAIAAVAPGAVEPPQWATLGVPSPARDTDHVIIARPTPDGTYRWFLFPGTPVQVTGREDDYTRVRLDDELEVWLGSGEVRPLPSGVAAPMRVTSDARIIPSVEYVDLEIPVATRPAFQVEETDRALILTLYDTRANTDIVRYGSNDSLVRVVRWEQVAHDRARYTLELAAKPYGYLAMWHAGAFVLRVRRPPRIDPVSPLKGLTIAVDPGHPPIGSTGPTGLYEAVPALAIAQRLRDLLIARGATVMMTRTTDAPVELSLRPILARRANANALVSIHLNAFPDGTNPFANNGTGTYFFQPHSEPLARALQSALVDRLGLRNIGVHYDNLALARPTWMPAVLCEGAFMMIPEQENALRTPEYQELYARGVVAGLENYFRALGANP